MGLQSNILLESAETKIARQKLLPSISIPLRGTMNELYFELQILQDSCHMYNNQQQIFSKRRKKNCFRMNAAWFYLTASALVFKSPLCPDVMSLASREWFLPGDVFGLGFAGTQFERDLPRGHHNETVSKQKQLVETDTKGVARELTFRCCRDDTRTSCFHNLKPRRQQRRPMDLVCLSGFPKRRCLP